MKHLKTFESESAFDAAKDKLIEPWVALVSDMVAYSSEYAVPDETTWYYSDGTSWSKLVEGELDANTAHNSDSTHAYGEITKVEIGKSATQIGSAALANCTNLTSVTIPNSVTSIGNNAFNSCTSLTSVKIGNSVTSIGQGAFGNCTSLTSVTIPNSVTSMGDGAFGNCTSLTSIKYNGVTYTSKSAIETALTSNGVTVGSNIFFNTALTD